MKSIKNLLLVLIAALSFTSAHAAPSRIEKISYHTMQLKARINKEVDKINMDDMIAKDGLVRVNFIINENGKINVLQSNYSDIKLYEAVKQILDSIKLGDSTDLAGKAFIYQFKFKADGAY